MQEGLDKMDKNQIGLDNIIIYDKETIKGCFLTSFYFPYNDTFIDVICKDDRNDISLYYKILEENQDKYFIGYNNINFDAQILEKIVDSSDFLPNLEGKEVSKFIWQFAQDLIETSRFGGYLPYREYHFRYKQLDPFKILHGENRTRIGSMSLIERHTKNWVNCWKLLKIYKLQSN